MVVKSLNLLKKNSVIILFYAIYMVIMYLIMFLLLPMDMNRYADPITFDFRSYLFSMAKMMVAISVMSISGLLFAAGIGSMISEAIKKGTTSAASFFPGVKKYFVRVMLSSLLLAAFSIGLSILLSVLTIPIIIISVMQDNLMLTLISSLFIGVVALFALPFVILWFPAIFMEDIGVMQGMRNGFRASVKNYWKLLLVIFAMYIPMIVYAIINYDNMAQGNIYNPSYFIMILLTSIISIIVVPIIFMTYHEYKQKVYLLTVNNRIEG